VAAFNLDDFPVVKADTLSVPHSLTIYGPPGKGKSVLAASICKVPGFERTLMLDTEGGAVSLGRWYPEVDVLPVQSAAGFQKAFEAVMNEKLVERESNLPYQALIIDTLDKAQERQIEAFDRSPEANANGKKNALYKWGAIKQWISKIADGAHQAPFFTIFVVHSEDYKSEETGVNLNTVMLQGSSRFNFPSVSDAVGYFDVVSIKGDDNKRTEHRSIDFRQDSRRITKQRFASSLDGVILDPTMQKIFDKISSK
jgi:hypothetical protein